MDLYVTMIGTAASVPTAARGTAATLGPRGLTQLMTTLRPVIGRLPYAVDLDEVEPRREEEIWAGDACRIEAFPTRHSVASLGYAVREDARPGAFDVAAARALGVPEGPAWG